jgi:CHAT domain-containing protein
MVELLVEKNNYAEAFAYAERAKGRVLLDVLQSGKANITKAVTEAEAEQERKLRGEIINLNKQISRENSLQQPDTARLAELKANLQKARLAFESFQTDLYVAHPELKVQRGEVRSLTLDQTSKLLDQKTAFLEFVFGEDVSYLFVLTKAEKTNKRSESELDLKTYKLSVKGKDLTARVENFRQLLAERNLDYQESARELYDLIIKPAQQQLRGKTVLGIIPDGALWELPFQALQPREGRFLLEDCAIFYAPSLSVLREIVERSIGLGSMQARAKAEKIVGADKGKEFNLSRYGENSRLILLAFGNPALNGETVSLAKSVYRDEPLGSLPEAETEVKTLARIYGPGRSKILIGAEARESLAKSEASRYRILHFATHGILDDFNPLYSHLLLTAQDGDVTEDGLLEAWEIMRMNLQADLVVLSACQTARGKVGAGEGMIGMTWALFVAGSPTTLASQWKVDSASTTELMIKFHSRLTSRGPKGQAVTKAEALRGAVQELMKDRKYRHPFYWAGFVLVGNGF